MKPTRSTTRSTQYHSSSFNSSGFTLLEIMVVIAIIMLLAAMTIGGLSFANKKAKISQTEIFISSVSQALEQYRADNGDLPQGSGDIGSTQDVYNALYGDSLIDDAAQVYLPTLNPNNQGNAKNVDGTPPNYVIVDAWKNPSGERQEIFYRRDPNADPANPDPNMMNPPTDFDLWSVGPDGINGERADDIKNW